MKMQSFPHPSPWTPSTKAPGLVLSYLFASPQQTKATESKFTQFLQGSSDSEAITSHLVGEYGWITPAEPFLFSVKPDYHSHKQGGHRQHMETISLLYSLQKTYSLKQIHIEHLLHGRHCPRHWGTSVKIYFLPPKKSPRPQEAQIPAEGSWAGGWGQQRGQTINSNK